MCTVLAIAVAAGGRDIAATITRPARKSSVMFTLGKIYMFLLENCGTLQHQNTLGTNHTS